jgi:hypothetical protein
MHELWTGEFRRQRDLPQVRNITAKPRASSRPADDELNAAAPAKWFSAASRLR